MSKSQNKVGLLAFVTAHPRAILLIWLIILAPAILGIKELSLTSDTRVFFDASNPYLAELRDFENKYSQNNNLLFVVHDENDTLFSKPNLELLLNLTEDAWKLPQARRVDSLTNFQDVFAVGDAIEIANLVPDSGSLDESKIESIREKALGEQALVNRLISEDGKTAGVNVDFTLPNRASQEIEQIVQAARALARSYEEKQEGISIQVTGNVALMRVFSEAIEADQITLIPVTLALMALILGLLLRSVARTGSGSLAFSFVQRDCCWASGMVGSGSQSSFCCRTNRYHDFGRGQYAARIFFCREILEHRRRKE